MSPSDPGDPALPPLDLRELDEMLRFLPIFEAPGFRPGRHAGGDRLPDGSLTMPYIEYSDEVCAFQKAVSSTRFGFVFDWNAWAERDRYWEQPSLLTTADLTTLRKLMTAITRAERFSEGTWMKAFEKGLVTALLRRLKSLRAQADSHDP